MKKNSTDVSPAEPLQSLRGFKDHTPQDSAQYRHIVQVCESVCRRFHYQEINTPILENASVFLKTLGTEILNKEIYQFQDKSELTVALRPEGTAGVVRFLISSKLYQENQRLRFFYSGPMFRYERPQKGRLRQFHQFGVEFFGEHSARAEVELISMSQMVLKELGILPKTQLIINSIGDEESRLAYRTELVKYLTPLKEKLSPESQVRLGQNPLRILDSKSDQDQKILKQAPLPKDFLNSHSKRFYEDVLNLLNKYNIKYQQQDFLVRGLDYYSHTVFEWVSSELGAQDAVLAGGRYDKLVETMGGAPCPAIGWACGIERLALICPKTSLPHPFLGVATMDESLNPIRDQEVQNLREATFSVYIPESGNFSKQMNKIHKQGIKYTLIIAPNEWKNKEFSIKNMETGEQTKLPAKDLITHLKTLQKT